MKKLYFLLAIALMSFHANAQILLDEDFLKLRVLIPIQLQLLMKAGGLQ